MTRPEPKYKNVDKWVYGEVKEIKLIGEDDQLEKGMYYFVFWINHNNQHLSTHVSHKELFEWFKIDQIEFDNGETIEENCQMLCREHHYEKTAEQTKILRLRLKV